MSFGVWRFPLALVGSPLRLTRSKASHKLTGSGAQSLSMLEVRGVCLSFMNPNLPNAFCLWLFVPQGPAQQTSVLPPLSPDSSCHMISMRSQEEDGSSRVNLSGSSRAFELAPAPRGCRRWGRQVSSLVWLGHPTPNQDDSPMF